MINRLIERRSFWSSYLRWYRYNLWANWVFLPIFIGLFIGLLTNQSNYSDLYETVSKSRSYFIYGQFDKVGFRRNRRVEIHTKYDTVEAWCGFLHYGGDSCIDDNISRNNNRYKIEVSDYKGKKYLLGISSIDGKEILSRDKSLERAKSQSIYARSIGYPGQAAKGFIIALLLFSVPRYFIYIAPRRQKKKPELKNDQ